MRRISQPRVEVMIFMVTEISCINAGFEDCEFLVRSEDEEEVIEFARRHAMETHGTEASREQLQRLLR